MAWVYEQKFDTLNNGNLNGQDSWSGSTDFQVTTSNPYKGAKAVIINGNAGGATIIRNVTATSTGVIYFAIRSGVTNKNVTIQVRSGAGDSVATIFLDNGGDIRVNQNIIILGSYSVNTWYPIALEYDVPNNRARGKVYTGGAWGAFSNWVATDTPNVDVEQIWLSVSVSTTNGMFDEISPNDITQNFVSNGNFLSVF